MSRGARTIITSIKALRRRSAREREARDRSLDALASMRREPTLSLRRAARESETRPETVLRYAGVALEKQGGRYVVARGDRLIRTMIIYAEGEKQTIIVRGDRVASLISRYHLAIKAYLNPPFDEDRLRAFRGKKVAGHVLETNLDAIDEIARRGEITSEDIYDNH